MRLSSLIASNDTQDEKLTLHGDDIDITGITTDSRKVKSGFLFIAIPIAKSSNVMHCDHEYKNNIIGTLLL